MTLVEFAERLGVSDRVVSKWERGGDAATPRPVNQAVLDTFLAKAGAETQGRFVGLLSTRGEAASQIVEPEENPGAASGRYSKHPLDGKLMVKIPEGIFLRGTESEPTWVDGFHIDVFATTNADYARFCTATGHRPPAHWGGARCPRELYAHPVVEVSWHDANAYAAWAGKVLPSAKQWEKSARGTTGTTYPWGNQRTAAKCNVRETGIGATTPVSQFHSGVSPYGVYDLVGNIWEWCSTTSTKGRYELKGSAWTSPFSRADPAAFNDANDFMRDDDTGFRCVVEGEDFPSSGI